MDITYDKAPGRIGGKQHVRISETEAARLTAKGETLSQIRFEDVTGARLAVVTGYGVTAIDLVLEAGPETLRLSHRPNPANRNGEAELKQFTHACLATLRGLGRAKPSLQVKLCAGAGVRWMMFGFAILGLTASAGIVLAVLAQAAGIQTLAVPAIMATAAIRGGWLTPPWMRAKRMTAAALGQSLAAGDWRGRSAEPADHSAPSSAATAASS